MNAKPKSNSIITTVYNEANDTITYTVLGVGDITFDLTKVSKLNLARAAVHGFGQRIPDAAAIGVTDDDGNVIPKADRNQIKFNRMKKLVEFYEQGGEDWSRKGTGEGGGKSITLEALARVQGISYDDAEKAVASRAEKMGRTVKQQLNKLREAEAIKKAINDIRNERLAAAPTSVDANSELDAMGATEAE